MKWVSQFSIINPKINTHTYIYISQPILNGSTSGWVHVDLRLMKMGQAMTIKVAMADAIGCLGRMSMGRNHGKTRGGIVYKGMEKHKYIYII